MTVEELTEKLKTFPKEMIVGGMGHFCELLHVIDVHLSYGQDKFLVINIESAGAEPE